MNKAGGHPVSSIIWIIGFILSLIIRIIYLSTDPLKSMKGEKIKFDLKGTRISDVPPQENLADEKSLEHALCHQYFIFCFRYTPCLLLGETIAEKNVRKTASYSDTVLKLVDHLKMPYVFCRNGF